jgi:hypothetical protein
VRFDHANPTASIVGINQSPAVVNYLIGNDPTQWHTDLPTYSGIVYQQLYRGIELRYEGTGGQLKSTYVIAPGVEPSRLRWRYDGKRRVYVDGMGNLVIELDRPNGQSAEDRTLIEQAPVAWQDIERERRSVDASYTLANDGSVGFALGQYDPTYPLTIDPILTYSTFLGSGGEEEAFSIAVDGSQNIYLTGYTYSTSFPTNRGTYPRIRPCTKSWAYCQR